MKGKEGKGELLEDIKYIIFGIITAYLLNFTLGLVLGTDLPVVAVVSGSMTHDSTTPHVHYQFLLQELNYSKEFVDSWPLKNGFHRGDVLVVKGVEEDDVEVGDVIIFDIRGQNVPIVHRVVKIKDEYLITKGDHNTNYDPDCKLYSGISGCWERTKIHGKAVLVIPFLGWPKLILTEILIFARSAIV